ncbi:polysaccharide deacetylase family protein [Corallococcus carmarthensis]|uniref:Twin-arginine translocation signal domain-containing protein n=1 Tax=Corallococcus carmarthensis TaxID=2316728 RepID=A0A3A8JVG8_9BACT|nr:polysaccharide deacetylase family protein [Corallococcus carmarthensis]RKG99907.1 twin-arginine translocation signal domain-containing protein [Corallococcus carmarthensis]
MSTRRQFLSGTAVAAGALAVSGAVAAEAPARGTPKASAKKGFWPGGARLAISLSLQFEAGAQPERGASSPFPPIDAKYPDLPVATWYEYGVREGIPRLLEMFSRRGVQVTSHMVGQAVERNPALAKEIVERGHEAAAHGQTWTPQFSMTPEEERASYEANVRAIQRATGQTPVGFNAFWMRGTPRTLEILQDLGFLYHIDDVSRDEPFVVDVRGKPFAVVPYTLGMNDILNFESRNYTADQFASELKNEFDALYAEAGERRRMMSISMHDRISGRPGRVKMLEEFIRYAQRQPGVWFARKDALARWTLEQAGT